MWLYLIPPFVAINLEILFFYCSCYWWPVVPVIPSLRLCIPNFRTPDRKIPFHKYTVFYVPEEHFVA